VWLWQHARQVNEAKEERRRQMEEKRSAKDAMVLERKLGVGDTDSALRPVPIPITFSRGEAMDTNDAAASLAAVPVGLVLPEDPSTSDATNPFFNVPGASLPPPADPLSVPPAPAAMPTAAPLKDGASQALKMIERSLLLSAADKDAIHQFLRGQRDHQSSGVREFVLHEEDKAGVATQVVFELNYDTGNWKVSRKRMG